MLARLAWLLMRMLMGVSVIHVVLVFSRRKVECIRAFMQKLFRSDYFVDARAGGIERQSASSRIGIRHALPSYMNVIGLGPDI